MTDIQELQEALDRYARLAPDGTGIVAAAQAGATRIRRRRLHLGIAATAVGTTAALVTASAVLPGGAQRGPTGLHPATSASPAVPASSPASVVRPGTGYRGTLQMTVDLAPGAPYSKLEHGTLGSSQFIIARSEGGAAKDWGGTIEVHDPGTFDPAPFRSGERVSVEGRDGYYVPGDPPPTGLDTPTPPSGTPARRWRALAWADPSGAWAVITEGTSRDGMLDLAKYVRFGAPRSVVSPVRFGYVPAGLPGVYVRARIGHGNSIQIGLGPGGAEPAGDEQQRIFGPTPPRLPVTVYALPHSDYNDTTNLGGLGEPTRIAGVKTWYRTTSTPDMIIDEGRAVLFISTLHCVITITVAERDRVPYAELTRMVENADFRNCEDARTWTAPLP